MMKTSRTRLSIASLSAVASSRWMARRCEQSIWGLTTPRLRDHRQWLINRPEFPEFRRQNFRNPHLRQAVVLVKRVWYTASPTSRELDSAKEPWHARTQ